MAGTLKKSKLYLVPVRWCYICYKRILSPLFGNACRFYPCCSDYAMEAIEKYGLMRGSYYTFKRIIRCHPYCKGGIDPVP